MNWFGQLVNYGQIDMQFKKCLEIIIDPSLRNKVDSELLCACGPHEETVLHYLVVENRLEAVRWLFTKGVDCNTVNSFGNTPLMDSIVLNNEEMVALLLENGADPNFQNEFGDTALHKAYESKSSDLIKELLRRHGASDDILNDLGDAASEFNSVQN
jgi:ankyrin repeat protein